MIYQGINFYRTIYGLLLVLGVFLVVNANIFTTQPSDLTALQTELHALKGRLATIQADVLAMKNGGVNVNKTIHAEVLEVVRAERNMYERIQDNERHTRNFLISILGVIIAVIGLSSLFGVQHFVKKIAATAEADLAGTIRSKVAQAQATLFNHMGYFRFAQCDDEENKADAKKCQSLLDSAITSTEYALDAFRDINDRGIPGTVYLFELTGLARATVDAHRLTA